MGVMRTIHQLTRNYYWPNLYSDVRKYVDSCFPCQSNKTSHQFPQGLARSIITPPRRWGQVTLDLITGLPRTRSGKDALLVMVDKYSKLMYCVAVTSTITAPEVAKIFMNEVVRHHGMQSSIISDRDSKFTSSFWKTLFEMMGTRLALSTAYHPRTDGQTERSNRTIEQILRSYVN